MFSTLIESKTTSEYTAVLGHLKQLTESLRAIPGAEEALLVEFKQKSWVGIAIRATAKQLLDLALVRIRKDVRECRVFIDMLNNIEGMDQVVSSIESNGICEQSALHVYKILVTDN